MNGSQTASPAWLVSGFRCGLAGGRGRVRKIGQPISVRQRAVGGVSLADQVVLPDRAVDGESVACDVGGQGLPSTAV
jgi:hypothetical protein